MFDKKIINEVPTNDNDVKISIINSTIVDKVCNCLANHPELLGKDSDLSIDIDGKTVVRVSHRYWGDKI